MLVATPEGTKAPQDHHTLAISLANNESQAKTCCYHRMGYYHQDPWTQLVGRTTTVEDTLNFDISIIFFRSTCSVFYHAQA